MIHRSATSYSLEELFDHLQSKGVLQNRKEAEKFIFDRQGQEEQPLYLKILAGVGAFMASFFFIGFLFLAGIISLNKEVSLLTFGVIFIGAAIAICKYANTQQNNFMRHSFVMQLSFTWMALGKTLFVWGISMIMETKWDVPIAGLIVTLITYNIYKMSIDRFLSSLAVLVSTLTAILSYLDSSVTVEVLFSIFFNTQLVAVAFLFTNGRIRREYAPLAYALACSLCVCVLIFALQYKFFISYSDGTVLNPFWFNPGVAIAFIALIGWASGDWGKLKSLPFIIATIGIVLLSVVSAPGIILSIGFLVLGYSKSDSLITIMGALLLPVFIFFYYYNLDVTLLRKSIILVSSGVILLAGFGYLKFKKWDKGGEL